MELLLYQTTAGSFNFFAAWYVVLVAFLALIPFEAFVFLLLVASSVVAALSAFVVVFLVVSSVVVMPSISTLSLVDRIYFEVRSD